MLRGAQISYRLRLRGLPLRRRSEITAWEPPHRFVDEHAPGPYRSWVHERRFEARERPGRDPVVVAHDEVLHQAPLRLPHQTTEGAVRNARQLMAFVGRGPERLNPGQTAGARPQTRAGLSDRVPRVPCVMRRRLLAAGDIPPSAPNPSSHSRTP